MIRQNSPLYQPTLIILINIIAILSLYPLWNNYKYNDNSHNWLAYDLGLNSLSSAEEYSIFMTEGADNQVFSMLYFTYAQKLRQDIFPYDQVGNIFKKIYGDMRHMHISILEERRLIVNKGLFNGEEPFYVDIRSSSMPYFVPYAFGKPNVYMTWRMPKLELLGNYYAKSYGQVFKLQDIKYAIIDFLEIRGAETFKDIHDNIMEILNREVSSQELQQWISELVIDGYIFVQNETAVFIKTYKKPFPHDSVETSLRRWNKIPNLKYLDFLSRNNVLTYVYDEIRNLTVKIKQQQIQYRSEIKEEKKEELLTSMRNAWKQISEHTDTIKEIGPDAGEMLHNIGMEYFHAHKNFDIITSPLIDQALDLWDLAIEASPYRWYTYFMLIMGYLKQALLYPENAPSLLEEIDTAFSKMVKNMKHWTSMRNNMTETDPYKSVINLINFRQEFQNISGDQFVKDKALAIELIDGPAENITFEKIAPYLYKSMQQLPILKDTSFFTQFMKFWQKLWNKKKTDFQFFTWHIQTLGSLVQYEDFIDISFYQQIAKESVNILPKIIEKNHLALLFSLMKIARAAQYPDLEKSYKTKLLKNAQNILSPDEYSQILQQLDQI